MVGASAGVHTITGRQGAVASSMPAIDTTSPGAAVASALTSADGGASVAPGHAVRVRRSVEPAGHSALLASAPSTAASPVGCGSASARGLTALGRHARASAVMHRLIAAGAVFTGADGERRSDDEERAGRGDAQETKASGVHALLDTTESGPPRDATPNDSPSPLEIARFTQSTRSSCAATRRGPAAVLARGAVHVTTRSRSLKAGPFAARLV